MLRDANGKIELPSEEIKLEGELKVKAERLRDELAAHLKEKGTEGLPKSRRRGEGDKADLMGAWLSGADLSEAQLQEANLTKAQLQNANLGGAQLQRHALPPAGGGCPARGSAVWRVARRARLTPAS